MPKAAAANGVEPVLHCFILHSHGVGRAQLLGARDFIAVHVQRDREAEVLPAEIHWRAVVIAELEFEFAQLVQRREKCGKALRRVLWFVPEHVLQHGHNQGGFGPQRDFGKCPIHNAVVIVVAAVIRVHRVRLHFVLVVVPVNFHVHVRAAVQAGRVRWNQHVARPP